MEDHSNHLRTSVSGSMSSDLVKHYKRENIKFTPPKARKTKHHFVIPNDKAKKSKAAK